MKFKVGDIVVSVNNRWDIGCPKGYVAKVYEITDYVRIPMKHNGLLGGFQENQFKLATPLAIILFTKSQDDGNVKK